MSQNFLFVQKVADRVGPRAEKAMTFWQEIITLTRPIRKGVCNLQHKFYLYLIFSKVVIGFFYNFYLFIISTIKQVCNFLPIISIFWFKNSLFQSKEDFSIKEYKK